MSQEFSPRPLYPSNSDTSDDPSFDDGDIRSCGAGLEHSARVERCMGDTEASYYLPSRANGVNDMYLHLGLKAAPSLMSRSRVALVWAIMRLRHPLWASQVDMRDYKDIRFVYMPHKSPSDALLEANETLAYSTKTKDQLIDTYLNGPRTLSNTRLTYLIISTPQTPPSPPQTPADLLELPAESPVSKPLEDHEFFLCATHFIGDGMSLHPFASHFFGLLGGELTNAELRVLMEEEWSKRWGSAELNVLPASMEERLPQLSTGRFFKTSAKFEFDLSQKKLIGGHTFPRVHGRTRRTIVPTVSIDEVRTKQMLNVCKSHGVPISAAIFALCNIAWARTTRERRELPIMIYSAINLRPFLLPTPSDSYCFISIGYFNVVLPSFFPGDATSVAARQTFWHRAKLAKQQSIDAAKNPMIISRSRLMAEERGHRARGWAKEDDERAAGTWVVPTLPASPPPVPTLLPKAPSAALIGLSLLGNLDGIYNHARFPALKLHTLTNSSRQRAGGMLLFGYTFVGKLWLSLGYDENGLDKDVVERFWMHTLGAMDELLLEYNSLPHKAHL